MLAMTTEEIVQGLNDQQREAVTYNNGPLLLIAGAGTGKTAVITKKIAYLVTEKLAKPEQILALTFTKKAAAEMEERVDILLPYGYNQVMVATFHSFAEQILRDYAYHLGFSTNFKLLMEPQQIMLVRDHIFDFGLKKFAPLSDPMHFIRDLLKLFSKCKEELISSSMYLEYAQGLLDKADSDTEQDEATDHMELARSYAKYQELLAMNDRMDFSDLTMRLIEALKAKPKMLADLQARFKYIVVDEFQDTNVAQNELLKILTIKEGSSTLPQLTVVGDDDQSIYRFRGANVANMMDFTETWSSVKQIVLKENYRNTQEILDASYRLIQNNNPDRLETKYGIDKKLVAHQGSGPVPQLIYSETITDEAQAVVEKIISLKNQEEGVRYSTFAILTRSNNQAAPFINALTTAKIPYVFSGSEGLFRKTVIRDLVSFLKVLSNPAENLALFNIMTSEIIGADFDQLSVVLHQAKSVNIPLEEFLRSRRDTWEKKVPHETITKIDQVLTLLQQIRLTSVKKTAGEIIYDFLKDSEYLKRLATEEKAGSALAAEKITSIANFFDRVKAFQETSLDFGLQRFMEYLEILLELGEDQDEMLDDMDFDGVRVLTMHKAKGLEFEYVFMVGLVDGRIPARGRSDAFEIPEGLKLAKKEVEVDSDTTKLQLQEERRLFYVGMTRARKQLFLSAGRDYGNKKSMKLSIFVGEAIGQEKLQPEMMKSSPLERIRHFERQDKEPLYATRIHMKDGVLRLTRAQVDDYNTCPRKYKFIHITPIKLMTDPRVIFGRAVHAVIEEYYKIQLRGEVVPTLEDLITIYKDNWSSEGFLSQEHEMRRFDEGVTIITRFYHTYSTMFEPSAIEHPFAFVWGDSKVEGRIDMVEERVGGMTRIIDFKTSDVDDQTKADDRAKKSVQLAVYALALEMESGKVPDEVGLFFLGSGILGTAKVTDKMLEKAKEDIVKAGEGIRSQDFTAKPDKMTCSYCPFSLYCDDAAV